MATTVQQPEFIATVEDLDQLIRGVERADENFLEILASRPHPGRQTEITMKGYALHAALTVLLSEAKAKLL